LREFQDLVHTVVLIIGDFTAQIGDPSDKLQKRPFLGKDEIKKNLKNYLPQVGKILNLKKIEVYYNSKWLKKLDFQEISQLADSFSVQQMLERRNFKDRLEKQEEISLRELLYPLMQGYDSVMVKADVELGGTDQLFNLLAGRKIQEYYGQKPQDVLTTEMVIGLDGRKMSTSWGNVINISDTPDEQFGKIMSIRDELIADYLVATTDLSVVEIDEISLSVKNGANPKVAKMRLGFEIVKRYHGEKAAKAATDNFEKLFSKKELPDDIAELKLNAATMLPVDIIIFSGVISSKSEARRLVEQGGFDVDSLPHQDPKAAITFKGGEVIKIGKKRFIRVIL
jgi:tyrosyl-tRNA synthetase